MSQPSRNVQEKLCSTITAFGTIKAGLFRKKCRHRDVDERDKRVKLKVNKDKLSRRGDDLSYSKKQSYEFSKVQIDPRGGDTRLTTGLQTWQT